MYPLGTMFTRRRLLGMLAASPLAFLFPRLARASGKQALADSMVRPSRYAAGPGSPRTCTLSEAEYKSGRRHLPLTEGQVQRERAESLQVRDDRGVRFLGDDVNFTCDECHGRYVCIYAFDPYNTDGDCLDLK